MKNTLLVAPWIVIVLLLIYIGSCTHSGKEKICPETKDSIHIDSAWRTIDNTKHYAKPKPDTIYYPDSIYLPADTAELIAECRRIAFEYFKTKIYNRHIIVDSIGWINLRDSVTQNELYGYYVNSKIKQLTVTKTETKTIVTPARNKILVGLQLSGNADYFGASPSIMFQGKKDNVFMLGYDVINKNYNVGAFVKIRLKK